MGGQCGDHPKIFQELSEQIVPSLHNLPYGRAQKGRRVLGNAVFSPNPGLPPRYRCEKRSPGKCILWHAPPKGSGHTKSTTDSKITKAIVNHYGHSGSLLGRV